MAKPDFAKAVAAAVRDVEKKHGPSKLGCEECGKRASRVVLVRSGCPHCGAAPNVALGRMNDR